MTQLVDSEHLGKVIRALLPALHGPIFDALAVSQRVPQLVHRFFNLARAAMDSAAACGAEWRERSLSVTAYPCHVRRVNDVSCAAF